MHIVRRIAEERDTSQLVPSRPRTELQRVRLEGIYQLLIILRIVLTFNLQTGWIHQDELSNSVEVVAGDYCDLQVFKPDGFNSTFPTQSIVSRHSTIYLPYFLLNYFLFYNHPVGKDKIPSSKMLLLIPRLFHLALSFLVDYIMVKFCILNDPLKEKSEDQEEGESPSTATNAEGDPKDDSSIPTPEETETTLPHPLSNDYTVRLVTLASSQVILIFATRTHSSSLNTLLFASLLYLVSSSFHSFQEYIPYLEQYHKVPKSDGVGKVFYLKKMKGTGYTPLKGIHWITLLTVIGVFNDPEFFISYACIPLFFYMQRGISHRLIGMKYFHARVFTFLALFCLFSVPFVLWDSFYYGKVSLEDFRTLNLSPESFVVTPANYFSRKSSQFRDLWGYVTILGLYFLVFNVIGVMGLVSFVKETYDIMFAEWRHKPNLDSQWTFLNCSLFLPLFALIQAHGNSYSVFDLAPLIFPLVYMHGHKIPLASRFSSKIALAWFACNFAGVVYFGYFSQGGILSSFLDLYDHITPIRFNDTQIDITFSQMTAIPATFALAIPHKWKTILQQRKKPSEGEHDLDLKIDFEQKRDFQGHHDTLEEDGFGLPPNLHKTVLKLEKSNKVRVYHTGHSPLPMSHLERDLHRLVLKQEQGRERTDKISFLLIPYGYGRESEDSFKMLKLTHVKTYWNHVFCNFFSELEAAAYQTAKEGFKWTIFKNLFTRSSINFGLSLYTMEKVKYVGGVTETIRPENNTKSKMDETFFKYFQFHHSFHDFIKLAGNLGTIVFTLGLYLTGYLVYLT